MTMRYMMLLCSLLTVVLLQAQNPATVECRTGEGIGEKMHLFKVVNGTKMSIADAVYNKNGYYGFKFMPEYEGFYVVGDERNYQYPVYLKGGETVSLYMDKDTVYLEGKKNTRENTVLYEWIALSKGIEAKSMHFSRTRSTYKDFFPDFEVFVPAADAFRDAIKTKNPYFDALMKRSVDFEKDLYALTFLYTPRTEHAKKEQRIAYYSTIICPDKFQDDVVLDMPYGMDLLRRYTMFVSMENNLGGKMESHLPLIPNQRLKGELVANGASGIRSYFEYEKYLKQYGIYLNPEQKARVEAVGSRLYEAQKGQEAADFTYPDAEGKMHSLSDYKGKVVLVDVWATWCGPCRQQLPHLKKLEEEMKGKDVVFIGVSVDEEKNYAKWKKFIVDEQLPGIQLFANGWSKIAKDYKITGIPRFMVFGKDGSVVEVEAPRPSTPELKELLEAELRK
ncbi:MAG: TlpA family protein disulfide reductase [Oscillibacter sp.]|nr:TlpA family protein disulfide reductase [Oscillibacter sp.]